MTSIRRTTWTQLGRPTAGELIKNGDAPPIVPLMLGRDETLLVDNPAWARDLASAAAATASVLESEHGLTRPAVESDRTAEERDVYRELLTRLIHASRPSEQWPAIRDARLALEHWQARP